jgi:hypothetical protein
MPVGWEALTATSDSLVSAMIDQLESGHQV